MEISQTGSVSISLTSSLSYSVIIRMLGSLDRESPEQDSISPWETAESDRDKEVRAWKAEEPSWLNKTEDGGLLHKVAQNLMVFCVNETWQKQLGESLWTHKLGATLKATASVVKNCCWVHLIECFLTLFCLSKTNWQLFSLLGL